MINNLAKKIFGSKNERELKAIAPLVSTINELEPKYAAISDEELSRQTARFKEQLANGATLDDILTDAFAVCREGSKRILGMRHFDVQLIGGTVLHQGKISEMKTGEGKTLCATLPAYLNALSGNGVHVVTVNDYLAKRDAEWMGRIYRFLGLTVGVAVHGISYAERKAAYAADITYGQNNEFGFDYLRDNMVIELDEMVQRGHNFAIVDEVDSILIDEARTPLIISGPSDDATDKYIIARDVVKHLNDELHYAVELKTRQVTLTEEGVQKCEELLSIDNLYDPLNIELVHHINQALKAAVIFKRDIDYVVRNNQIIIVDEFTGRLMPGRRWSDGLHQSVEAREGVKIVRESQTVATITFQNYFRMYKKLAGMTGTADTEAVEFKKIYNLDVVVIPTNRQMRRKDLPDTVFAMESGKIKAICKELAELQKKGQPVLVGTASIAKSELLSEELTKRGVPHHVLNAKQHEREAEIVAQAGRLGALTISTNMAGRGTDILLGGNPEFLAAAEAGTRDPADETYQASLEKYKIQCAAEKENVVAAGGLHILGTERHESRRIDNQLRGRSGRQGDPGSSQFFISFEDDLMKRFGGERMQMLLTRFGLTEDECIQANVVSRSIEKAQKRVEAFHFEMRKHVLEYDDVMNKQREVIYGLRNKILNSEAIEEEFLQMVPDVVEDIIMRHVSAKESPRHWNLPGLFQDFSNQFGFEGLGGDFVSRQEHADKQLAQDIYDYLYDLTENKYRELKELFGQDMIIRAERIVFLRAIDHFWREHLSHMDHLKEGMGLRGYAQKNPLYEYQEEAFNLFASMMVAVKCSVLQKIFIPEIVTEEQIQAKEAALVAEQRRLEAEAQAVHVSAPEISAQNESVGQSSVDSKRRAQQQESPAEMAKRLEVQAAEIKRKREVNRKKSKAARDARKRSR